MFNDNLIIYLFVFAAILIVMLFASFSFKIPTAGIPLAFAFNLMMNHYFGALIYALPWYATEAYEFTYLGFEQTVYGLAAFAVGSLLAGPAVIKFFFTTRSDEIIKPHPKLIARYFQIGIVIYFVLGPTLGRIPSFGTFVQSAWNLLIVAVCLLCWKAWKAGKLNRIPVYLALAAMFPFFTSFNSGFLNYGVRALMAVLFFVVAFYRPRWVVVLMMAVSIYMGLSVCETYFRDRDELREALWYERPSLSQRVQRVLFTVSHFEFLDLSNVNHLLRIDGRLNQNDFVGKSIVYLRDGRESFAHGTTFRDAFVSLVPRFLWPNKPVYAGSSDLVMRYTGQVVSENTSFGVGYVMEFYINFGTACVVTGFLLLGILLRILDFKAAQHLVRGNWQGFTLWFLPALGFTETLDTIPAIIAASVAAIIFCLLIHRFLLSNFFGFRLIPDWNKK